MVSNSLVDFNRFFVYREGKEITVDLRFYGNSILFISKEDIKDIEKIEILKLRNKISKL